jgi:hypothetical protein
MLDRRGDTAELDGQIGLGEAAIGASPLHRRTGVRELAERMNGNARHGTFVRRRPECLLVRLTPRLGHLVRAPTGCPRRTL